MNTRWAVLVAFALFFGAACSKRTIPNTDIEDTPMNRELVTFCENYRHAVEDLNVGLLLSMASPAYFDNSGTTSADDDMDRARLEEVLKTRFASVKTLRYEMKYRDIFEKDSKFFIEYTYTMSSQYMIDGKPKWTNKTADNRLEIERVETGYLIVSGM